MPPSSNKIGNGANNPTAIQNAINNNTGGMGMFAGKFSTADLTNIAAFIAAPF
jgi:hypothetical protein